MKFKSQVFTAVSGSIGGITYSHNKGGMYTRGRAQPTNPNSAAQQAVRMYLATASANWANLLTAAQRTAWDNYAANTPVTDVFGDSILLSGQQMYIRSFTVAMRAGVTPVAAAPTVPGLTELNGIVISDGGGVIQVAYDNTDAWATTTGGALLIRTSRNISAGVNYFKGPYRFLEAVLGDTSTPPTSPESSGTNAFGQTLVSGQRTAVTVQAIDSTGRTSPRVSGIFTNA